VRSKRGQYALLVPNDSRETKNFFGDSRNTGVSVTIRWAPKTSKSASSGIVDHLKGPPKLRNNVGVGQCGHIWVSPGVYCDIILVGEGNVEFLPILDDIDADVKMGRSNLVLLKECGQLIGRLKWMVMRSVFARDSALRTQAQQDRRLQLMHSRERGELTARGPSSKLIPMVPFGASHH
jgi:hypothetical protein